MPKITAIKNSIYRSTHIRKGNGISRVYHNVKNMKRFQNGMAITEMLFALGAAKNHYSFNTVIFGGLMLYFAHKAEKFRNMQADLQKYYQPILDKAKQIYKH